MVTFFVEAKVLFFTFSKVRKLIVNARVFGPATYEKKY